MSEVPAATLAQALERMLRSVLAFQRDEGVLMLHSTTSRSCAR